MTRLAPEHAVMAEQVTGRGAMGVVSAAAPLAAEAGAAAMRAGGNAFDAAVAAALAAELKDGGYDLVLFGRMATDSANQTVGPMTAHLMGVPCVTAISKLDIAAGRGTAERQLEGASETVEFPLPAVVTIDEGLGRPRLPSLKGIMAAKKKPLEVKPAQLGAASLTVDAIALPPDRPPGRIIGEGADAVPELIRLLQTEAKVL